MTVSLRLSESKRVAPRRGSCLHRLSSPVPERDTSPVQFAWGGPAAGDAGLVPDSEHESDKGPQQGNRAPLGVAG